MARGRTGATEPRIYLEDESVSSRWVQYTTGPVGSLADINMHKSH